MKKDAIEQLAKKFRKGIEEAIECRVISTKTTNTTLPFFPNGCCDIASDLLALYFLENDLVTQCFHGEYNYDDYENRYPHSWLETKDGLIIDITADQFRYKPGFQKYQLSTVYVGKNRSFYNLFNENQHDHHNLCGIDSFPVNYQKMIKPLYDVIIQCIK